MFGNIINVSLCDHVCISIHQAATEMVKSSHNFEGLEDVVTQDSPLSKPDDTSDEESSEDRK